MIEISEIAMKVENLIRVNHNTGHELARELSKSFNGSMHLKSPFDPNEVWLGPQKVKWPAYKHGKFYFKKDESVFCGIHVERGFELGLNNTRNELLDDSWTWHYFIDSVRNGRLDERLKQLETVTGKSIIMVQLASSQRNSVRYQREMTGSFQCEVNDIGSDFHSILSIKDPYELLLRLNEEKATFWVDCFIGFDVQTNSEDQSNDVYEDNSWITAIETLQSFVR